MSYQPPRRRTRGAGSRAVNRVVTQRLRALDLSTEAGWKLTKRPGANDVPSYSHWTTYERKIRICATLTVAPYNLEVKASDIYAAAQLTFQVFPKFTFTHFAVYGQTNAGIEVHTRIIENYDSVTLGKVFSDFGVPGQRRSCVRANISPREQRWMTANATSILIGVQSLGDDGAPKEGAIIVDLSVRFSGTSAALRIGSRNSPREVTEGRESNI